ncbi:MAG: hypothetical protein HY303_08340 [Candidatus Wallbacteria bacterium]|nr:hypothetical protein [Candidatus Wallbacteria bacterium]
MDGTLERCLQDFRSVDSEVRLAALTRMEGLDDPRVTKALEALANDPNLHVAERVREVLAARTGEAFARGIESPPLGRMSHVDYWKVAAKLIVRHPGPLLGTALVTMVMMPMLVAAILFACGQDEAGSLVLASFVLMDSESAPKVSRMAEQLYPAFEQPLGLLLMALTASLQAWAVSRIYLGSPVSLGAGLAFGAGRLAALGATLLTYLFVALAPVVVALAAAIGLPALFGSRAEAAIPVLGIVAAIVFAYLALRHSLSTMCCATEGIRGWSACRRAGRLFSRCWGRVLLFSLATLPLPMLYSQFTIVADVNSDLAHLLFFIPYAALCGAAQVLLYYDVAARYRESGGR